MRRGYKGAVVAGGRAGTQDREGAACELAWCTNRIRPKMVADG